MPNAGSRVPLDRRPWNQRWAWGALAGLALAVHYAVGPRIPFPVLFLVPIMLAAWHGGPHVAVGLAVGMSAIRFGYFFLWSPPWTVLDAAVNAVLRGMVLVVVALLTAHIGRLHRAALQRVAVLEGLLAICAFCKRIRDEQQEWTPLEAYITARSAATFSHGICPECRQRHYAPELVAHGHTNRGRPNDPPPAGLDTAVGRPSATARTRSPARVSAAGHTNGSHARRP